MNCIIIAFATIVNEPLFLDNLIRAILLTRILAKKTITMSVGPGSQHPPIKAKKEETMLEVFLTEDRKKLQQEVQDLHLL